MCTVCRLPAQVVHDLGDELKASRIKLSSAVGNGHSSGGSVEGSLYNEEDAEKRVSVHLARPLYLVNGGSGQDMVATQVYLGDGGYFSDGLRSFITLQPKARTRVRFQAYCADFKKDNPTRADSFSVGRVPSNLVSVVTNIMAYGAANPEADITTAAQVAIWMRQGESLPDIQAKFQFTAEDEALARQFAK